MDSVIIGSPFGPAQFIALSPVLRVLHKYRTSLSLCCGATLYESGLAQRCPYLNDVLPLLTEGASDAEHVSVLQRCVSEGVESSAVYIPDIFERRGTVDAFVDVFALLSPGFHWSHIDRWQPEIWLEDGSVDPQAEPFVFLGEGLSEKGRQCAEGFSLPVYDAAKQTGLPLIDRIRVLARAERIVVRYGSYFWAACALSKPIDYLELRDRTPSPWLGRFSTLVLATDLNPQEAARCLQVDPLLPPGTPDPPAIPETQQLLELGQAAVFKKDYPRAVAAYSAAVAGQPEFRGAHAALEAVLAEADDFQKADWFDAVALRPTTHRPPCRPAGSRANPPGVESQQPRRRSRPYRIRPYTARADQGSIAHDTRVRSAQD